jgi:hypothetical protein
LTIELDLDELDEYEGKIYDFIKENRDCNQRAIRKSKICSPVWAIEKVNSLVKKGYVKDLRIGKSFHKYRVSDRKRYGVITKALDSIETELMSMKDQLLKIAELQDRGDPAVHYLKQQFLESYYQSMFTRLFRLLKLSDIDIGKEDSRRLHTRIISLIQKVTREPFYSSYYKDILTENKNLLNKVIGDLFKRETVKMGLDIDKLKNIVKNIERFEKWFGDNYQTD